jgi:hypothetical protein
MTTEFENLSFFRPGDYNVEALHTLFDQVIAWSAAPAPLRQTTAAHERHKSLCEARRW